jgi:hypothetical protein
LEFAAVDVNNETEAELLKSVREIPVDPGIAEIHHSVAEIEKDLDMVKLPLGLDRGVMVSLGTAIQTDARGGV